MLIDISPLRNNKEYRFLYLGQFISFIGTMMSLVALPYQVYEITKSTFAVGMLGIVELVPLLITAFVGGALSDIMDRKTLLIRAEIGLALVCGFLLCNALLPEPHLWFIYVMSALMSALNGLHRPSLDAMIPRLVQRHEIQATSVLSMFKSVTGMVGGPALAGLCISYFGLAWTYALDLITFVLSIAALSFLSPKPPEGEKERPSLKSVSEAFSYAYSRQELTGTYVIDLVAMIFAMPNALFPAIAEILGGSKTLGWLYSAPALGGFFITVFSGWTRKIRNHGAAVGIAAFLWGLSIICFGFFYESIFLALIFLCCAGAADGVSGIFRTTIWNETIPDRIRGRMAGLEMISYMSGPLLGNAQAGFMSSMLGLHNAIIIGGMLCVIGVMLSLFLLPQFWRYIKQEA
jgi:MFS family permease